MKGNGVFDVLSMSLFSMNQIPDWYYVSLINSEFISLYVDNFVNNTSHFQINDTRQLPIVMLDSETLNKIGQLCKKAIYLKKGSFSSISCSINYERKTLMYYNENWIVMYK